MSNLENRRYTRNTGSRNKDIQPYHFLNKPKYVTPGNMHSSQNYFLSIKQLKGFTENTSRHYDNQSYIHHLAYPFMKSLCHHITPISSNIISIIGFFLNTIFTVVLIHAVQSTSQAPRWMYATSGVGLFTYQMLSTADKMHLHASGQSTAFKEFFLHCVDVISNVFTLAAATITTHLTSHPALFFSINTFILTLCYFNHWHTFCTGVTSYQLFDINEFRFLMVVVHLASALVGPHLWEVELLDNVPIKFFLWSLCFLIGMMYAYGHVADILGQDGVGRNGSTIAGTSVLSPLVPVGCTLITGGMVAKNCNILQLHPIIYTSIFVFTLAKITIQLIISHMTRSEMILWDWVLTGPLLLLLGQYFKWLQDFWLMTLSLAWSGLYLVYFMLGLLIDIYYYALK